MANLDRGGLKNKMESNRFIYYTESRRKNLINGRGKSHLEEFLLTALTVSTESFQIWVHLRLYEFNPCKRSPIILEFKTISYLFWLTLHCKKCFSSFVYLFLCQLHRIQQKYYFLEIRRNNRSYYNRKNRKCVLKVMIDMVLLKK